MNVSKLHSYVSTKNGMSLKSLKKTFPSCGNIEDVITGSPELFWIATHNKNHTEVRAKLDVKLCYLYLTSTCDGNCGCLHICKDYLLSRKFCPSVCKYGFSHTIMGSHNRLLLPFNKHSQWEVLLRSSFPRLCSTFASSAKCDKEFCGYLHLCYNFVHNTCLGKCELATAGGKLKADIHNCGNDHNKKVLNNFRLSHLKNDRKILFANILSKKNDICEKNSATDSETKSCCTTSSKSTSNEVPTKTPLLLCPNYLNGNCNIAQCPCLHFCKEFLINGNKCVAEKCKFGFSHDLLIGNNKEIMERHALHNLPSWKLLEHVRNSFPRVCREYQLNNCSYRVRRKMHICTDYCSGTCRKKNCPLFHDLLDARNVSSLGKYGLEKLKGHGMFTQKQLILTNLMFSNPSSDSQSTNDTGNDKLVLLMCAHYLNGNCKQPSCPRLHMCKEFLINENSCSGKSCTFSHDPMDAHNKNLITKRGVADLSHLVLLESIRNSFPQVCQKYCNRVHCVKTNCNRLHLCLEFCFDGCKNRRCSLSHDLKNSHNMKILESYSLDKTRGSKQNQEAFILSNVMFSRLRFVETHQQKLKFSDSRKKAISTSNLSHAQNIATDKSVQSKTKSVSTLNLKMQYENPTEATELVPKRPARRSEPSEKYVFDFILNINENGFCKITKLLDLFEGELKSVENWLGKYKYTFRTVTTHNAEKYVYLCLTEIQPCYSYWQEHEGCKNSNCGMFHICRALLTGEPHNDRTCKFNHNLTDIREQNLIRKLAWKSITEEQIIMLLKIRYPFVCSDYLDQKCHNGDALCPNLHVCCNFLRGSCKKKESLCCFKHEIGLSGLQAKRLMKEYQLDIYEFRSCLMFHEKDMNEDEDNNIPASNVEFNWLKGDGICAAFLVGDCDADCDLLHPSGKLPYLWQYKAQDCEVWKNMPSSVNIQLEKMYCDPSLTSCRVDNIAVLFSPLGICWHGRHDESPITVRRLSTISSVKAIAGEVGATEWKWFWKSGPGAWTEYEHFTTSDDIEKAYLIDAPVYTFITTEFKYKVSFGIMKQQNLSETYPTEREVRRRPVYKDKDIIRQRKTMQASMCPLPAHWPKKFRPGERIPVDFSIRRKMEKSFISSIAKNIEVIAIEEICNEAFYERYERRKNEFLKRLTDINEKLFYHGTEHGVVDSICVQNFDWRLVGKHAAMYGHGSYFSSSARYSHRYTTADANDVHYMFVAHVLVGQYTEGYLTMTRPPPLPNSELELYDSCVNTVSNPSIFVVFERDQCYPRYLISYVDRSQRTQDTRSSYLNMSHNVTSSATFQSMTLTKSAACVSTLPVQHQQSLMMMPMNHVSQRAASGAFVPQFPVASATPVRQSSVMSMNPVPQRAASGAFVPQFPVALTTPVRHFFTQSMAAVRTATLSAAPFQQFPVRSVTPVQHFFPTSTIPVQTAEASAGPVRQLSIPSMMPVQQFCAADRTHFQQTPATAPVHQFFAPSMTHIPQAASYKSSRTQNVSCFGPEDNPVQFHGTMNVENASFVSSYFHQT